MAQGLVLSGGQRVAIPSKTMGANSSFWIDFKINSYASQNFLGNSTSSNNQQIYPNDANTVGWRGSATTFITLSEAIPLNTRHYLRFVNRADNKVEIFNISGDSIGVSTTTVGAIIIALIGAASGRSFDGVIYTMGITPSDGPEQIYINESDPNAVIFGDGTLIGGTWVEYTNGTVPQGVPSIGTIVPGETTASVPYTYNLSDNTGFQYRIDGGTALPASASPISVTGLAAGTPYDIEVRAVNASGAGAWSDVASFTTNAPAALAPQGTTNITAITPGETTASIAFTYSGADATEYDLYIDGNYESTTATSPATAGDLTAATTYTAIVVPVNATGDGTPSAGVEFTTDATPPTVATFTSGILHDNTKTPAANTTLLHASLYDKVTGELVLRVNSPTTDAQGRVVIESAALSASTDYDLNAETQDGQRIMPRGTAV